MRKWQSISIAVTAAAIMLTSACGGSQEEAAPAGAAVSVAPSGVAAAPGAGAGTGVGEVVNVAPSAAGKLSVWESDELGPVVTDSAGFTLYRFDNDTAQPPKSNCAGDCATTWPPVSADGASAADARTPRCSAR